MATRGANRSAALAAFMAAHFGLHMCTTAVVPLLPMIRDSFGLDYARAGLLLASYSLTYGIAQLPAAALSDRVSKRALVPLGLVGTGVACLGIAASTSYPHLMLSLALMSLAASTYHAPTLAMISQAFGKESRGRAMGMHMVGGSIGSMVTPVLAILVANATGTWRYSFLALGMPIFVAGAAVWMLAPTEPRAAARAAGSERGKALGPLQVVRVLGLLMMIAMVMQLLVGGVNSFLPLYLVDRHGLPKDVAGLMMGLVYGGTLVGAPMGGALSDRLGRKPVILFSVLALGPLLFLITAVPPGLALAAIIVGYGTVMSFRMPAMESLIADVVPPHRRATVLGGYFFLVQEALGVFTPVLGWMIDQFGLDNGFTFLAVLSLGFSLLAATLWRRV